ncbi:uncharacterized protein LOC116776353 [Danaus plexippus]|uniref:uncharacterized protein LOC116776353 n=1 Tax=Danaus plexippus TaxID=13037 RepID=UPI002AB09B8E|nr:uncharacterized protein LOC116776353 [Danaus plexippus]
MLRNSNYVYGDRSLSVPADLNFGSYIIDAIWKHGDKTAMTNCATNQSLSYRAMAVDAMNLSISLTERGVKRGDVIAISSENRMEYFSTLLGICCTGATVTTTNPTYTKGEHKYVLDISKPKLVFCSPYAYKAHGKLFHSLPYIKSVVVYGERIPNTLSYEDLIRGNGVITPENFMAKDVEGQNDAAIVLYSSGTTGLPKGVMLTHLNVIVTCLVAPSVDPNELTLYITPWYHTMGLIASLRVFSKGNVMLFLPKFECDQYLRTIENYKVGQLVVAPPVLVALSKYSAKYDVSSVVAAFSGAAPLKKETIDAAKKRFPNLKHVFQGYGMTETTFSVIRDTYDSAHLSKTGGAGTVAACVVIKIVDIETRRPLGPNCRGEICVKGAPIMRGYVGRDRGDDFDDEGFFKTGDIGYYDDDKYFFVVDRLKELIKYKGYQVPPAEIEAVLTQHPDILEAGVVGVPHEGGEAPLAFVARRPGSNLTVEEVKSYVAEKLSNPKHLRGGVRFVEDIPKNSSGKILRKKLREMLKNKSKL